MNTTDRIERLERAVRPGPCPRCGYPDDRPADELAGDPKWIAHVDRGLRAMLDGATT